MSMRVSTENYRPVSSNHVYAFTYNEDDKIMYIQFYNGCVYKYLGVPKGIYLGLSHAPSAGCYLWDNIRNVANEKERFPTINLGKKPLGYLSTVDNIQYEIYPDLAKLDQIDSQEIKVEKNFAQDKIDLDEYHRLMNALTVKREKVIKKLERDGYSFDDEPTEECPDKSVQGTWHIVVMVIKGLFEALGVLGEVIKFLFIGVFQLMSVFFGLMAIMSRMGR